MTDSEKKVRVRFAPSPTGRLHIGGARTAIFNWAYARAKGGDFILRIEDTDPERSTEENVQVILNAMKWLGLDWDEGPEVGGPFGPYRQMQRTDTYAAALEQLKASGGAYPCFCTKEQLDEKRAAAEASEGGYAGYDRTCRDLDPAEAAQRIEAGEPHVWRLRVPDDRGPIEFDDAVYGRMSFPADVMDDMILVRSDGSPTYNFAVVCDDANMAITHVIRGDDHLSNTPRQILIYEALGRPVPTFAHLSMILGADGKKLSKRHGATSVEEYRDRGYLSDAVVNFLALLGWSLDGETTIIDREKLCASFDLDRITKKDAVFDETKLDWMNGVYIREMGPKAFEAAAKPWIEQAGATEAWFSAHPDWASKAYPLLAERLTRLDEVPEKLAFLFWGGDVFQLDEKSVSKVLTKDGARADEVLAAARAIIADEENAWECESLQEKVRGLCDTLELKPKMVFQPVRVAVCGNMVSPPLFESFELMERADVVARIDSVLAGVFGK
ncbi:MAG: glutamate--tRNA ligase [Berryella intestinalis]|uniref:glutamate--tRNA ligase n=1 Tax=Berryella intestinalis TaxID=1531429 RepID=UPI002A5500EC|nr:glutamate--tRNA ligase [Berryella intestinalis]MDD7369392.1 glutamate--tRNA ligase [Berryella intestinalis]MDY3130041.1 glutamate--tRNA ligase [Berryella intestinalis]